MEPETFNYPDNILKDTVRARQVSILINSLPASVTSATIEFYPIVTSTTDTCNRLKSTYSTYKATCLVTGNVVTLPEFDPIAEKFKEGTYEYELIVVLSGGVKRTYMVGNITFTNALPSRRLT
jgi:hypothetical protein